MLSEILPELGRTHTIGFADGTGKVMRFCETTLKSDFGNGKIRTEQEFLSTLLDGAFFGGFIGSVLISKFLQQSPEQSVKKLSICWNRQWIT